MYNFGSRGNEFKGEYFSDTDYGPNGPFQLKNMDGTYTNLGVKFMNIGKNDILYEPGYFVNGTDISNSVFILLERSHIDIGPIDFIIEGNTINIRWSQLVNTILSPNVRPYQVPNQKDSSLEFWEFVSKMFRLKEYSRTLTVGNEWCIIYPNNVVPPFDYVPGRGPSQSALEDVKKYMSYNYGITFNWLIVPNIHPLEGWRNIWRIPGGGYVRGPS